MIESAETASIAIVPPASSPSTLDVSLRSLLFRELPPSFSAFLLKRKGSLLQEPVPVEERRRKYDVRKAIRIMRELLDLRQQAQEKLVEAALQSKEPTSLLASDAQSLPSICAEHFSLSFGSDAIGMVRERILDFLEAAVIFSSNPLFNFSTKYFFMTAPLVDRQELNLW